MNKQELINRYSEKLLTQSNSLSQAVQESRNSIFRNVIADLEQLDEPQKISWRVAISILEHHFQCEIPRNLDNVVKGYREMSGILNTVEFELSKRNSELTAREFIFEALESKTHKVKVPAIVAKWIKWNKSKGGSVFILFDIDKAMAFEAHQNDKGLIDWMIEHRNHDFLIRAWLDDYEIEEEPEWVVKHNDDFYIEDLVKVQGKKHAKTFGSESEAQKWAELCSGTVEKV